MTPAELHNRLTDMIAQDANGPDADHLLRRLTAFEGTFDSMAAAALAPYGMNETGAMRALSTLQQWGLIGRVAAPEPTRLEESVLHAIPPQAEPFATLHAWGYLERETIPARYFLLKSIIRALPPAPDALTRHYEYYRRQFGNIAANAHPERSAVIARDWSNIHAALTWGLLHTPKTALEFAWALQAYIRDHLPPQEQRPLLQKLLTAAQQRPNALDEGYVWKALGDLARREQALKQAQEMYQAALDCYTQGRATPQPIAPKLLYDLMALEDALPSAQDVYEHMLAQNNARGLDAARLIVLYSLHDVLMTQHLYHEARQAVDDLLRLYERLGNERGQCDALTLLGITFVHMGSPERARDAFAWALRLGERIGYFIGQMKTLWAWGQTEYQHGQTAAGCALCRQAVVALLASPRVQDHPRAEALRPQLAAMEQGAA